MANTDLRWIQSFNNYKKALIQLNNAVSITEQRPLSELEQQGLIQGFEYTHEMAWKTLKRFLEHKGGEKLFGSKDTTRKAHSLDLLSDGDTWMDMIKSRNQTSHTYNRG